ncbi:MAG: ABC transporter ATP-binding protein [Dysosmobacter sp.]
MSPPPALDCGNQFRLLRQVRRLAEQGYTVLLSTHDPEHAFGLPPSFWLCRTAAFGPAARWRRP